MSAPRAIIYGTVTGEPKLRAGTARFTIEVETDGQPLTQDVHVTGTQAEQVSDWSTGDRVFVVGDLLVDGEGPEAYFWIDGHHVAREDGDTDR